MGKTKEATVARSSRAKRKSTDQAAQPQAELQQPKAKKVKKQAEPAAAAEPTARPKRDQKTSKKAESKPAKKSDKKAKPEHKAEKKPKRQSKRKQAEAEEEDQQQEEEPNQSVHDMFMEEVHAKETELNKHCLIMGQVETEEDETTLEELRALTRVFVPQQVQDDFMELWEELDEVGQESEEEEEEEEDDQDQPDILGAIMKAILGGKMLNTKHSSQMHTIFKTHQDQIDKAIKSKGWQKAFCRWAAILMASHREKHWYEDTDCPQDAEAAFKRMQQQWTKLKARSDEELGGLVAEGSKTPKEEFDAYLQAVADDMRNMDYSV